MTAEALSSATLVDLGSRRRDARSRLSAMAGEDDAGASSAELQQLVEEVDELVSESEVSRQ